MSVYLSENSLKEERNRDRERQINISSLCIFRCSFSYLFFFFYSGKVNHVSRAKRSTSFATAHFNDNPLHQQTTRYEPLNRHNTRMINQSIKETNTVINNSTK